MTDYQHMSNDFHFTWPDVLVVVAICALLAFTFWLLSRDDGEED